MLSRRLLRVKVLQAIYAYYQSTDITAEAAIKNLHTSIQKTFQLYLQLLQLFIELTRKEEQYRADKPQKMLSTNEATDLQSLKSIPFINYLSSNKLFEELKKEHQISWKNDNETLEKIFFNVRSKEEYKEFIQKPKVTESAGTGFGTWLFREMIAKSDVIRNKIEEQNIYWADSLDLVLNIMYKKIKDFNPAKPDTLVSKSFYKDEEDDKLFLEKLFKEVLNHHDDYEMMIEEKAKNWEIERIAMIDTILLKMALTEIMHFPTIPPKVSMNEYIDISKDYSTPKSRIFINGLLDKLMHDLKSEGKVVKTGRGLIE
ncbi:MAG: transcription antitermination factor NusB [Bacteroidia bacterium]|nr:transcription antitermination factor NusB [Bacteroidia bacterium]NNC86165.1 transcription antitermination factor NusB [Bacteroidia bacterium]NNM15269.1 transcription antitermination factor NusB [Bacteroidia bacterium]